MNFRETQLNEEVILTLTNSKTCLNRNPSLCQKRALIYQEQLLLNRVFLLTVYPDIKTNVRPPFCFSPQI